jgi:glucose/arabinose dehydrogenase
MPLLSTYRLLSVLIALLAISCVTDSNASSQTQSSPERDNKTQACQNDDSGLTLPPGFCAAVFADDIGHARHMVVAPSGVLYVNTWSGRYYGNDKSHAGGYLVAHASIRHRCQRIHVRRCRNRHQFSPGQESDTEISRRRSLHGTGDSRGDLAP